jgi:uncharacterized membrane protein YidH (DUF202 family)
MHEDGLLGQAAIDEELYELEKLISMQQRKVELLRARNAGLPPGPPSEECTSPRINTTVDVLKSLGNPVHTSIRDSTQSVQIPGQMSLERDDPDDEARKMTRTEEMGGFQRLIAWFWTAGAEHDVTLKHKQSKDALDRVTRFNRLGTDLANERTMLAWTRTALATARTVFSFFAFDGITNGGKIAQHYVLIALGSMAFIAYSFGWHRFKQVKHALRRHDPPLYFNRLSANPLFVIFFTIFTIILFSTIFKNTMWVK